MPAGLLNLFELGLPAGDLLLLIPQLALHLRVVFFEVLKGAQSAAVLIQQDLGLFIQFLHRLLRTDPFSLHHSLRFDGCFHCIRGGRPRETDSAEKNKKTYESWFGTNANIFHDSS